MKAAATSPAPASCKIFHKIKLIYIAIRHHLELFGEEVRDESGQTGEEWSQKDAHVTDVDGDVQEGEQMVDGSRGDHQTRVDGATNDTSKRVPRAIVKPVVEVVEALFSQEPSRAVVEVRIKFVDDALKTQDREEASGEGKDGGHC